MLFIGGFEQARPNVTVDLDRRFDDLVSDLVHIHLCDLCALCGRLVAELLGSPQRPQRLLRKLIDESSDTLGKLFDVEVDKQSHPTTGQF